MTAPELDPRDVPYRLKDILPIAYPQGNMTITGLRREIARGNLVVELVAGRQYVTLRAIEEMRERCRVKAKAPASGSGRRASSAGSRALANTSSSMEQSRSAQDALRANLARQKETLRATSRINGDRAAGSGR